MAYLALAYDADDLIAAAELEIANEIISMSDAIATCQADAQQLVLRLCSAGLRGRSLDTAHSLCAELSVISAKVQQLSRRF